MIRTASNYFACKFLKSYESRFKSCNINYCYYDKMFHDIKLKKRMKIFDHGDLKLYGTRYKLWL